MPTPRRTSRAEIVRAGRTVLEAEGPASLTMARVAAVVGVRPPSLYKHVESRDDLVRLIASDALAALGRRLDAVVGGDDPRRDLEAMAGAYRAFARANPETYGLLFARLPEGARPDAGVSETASEALLRTVSGADRPLEAARTVAAWSHGFVSMELAGAFRLGGDVDAAFEYGIGRLAAALLPDASGER
jgi:AcrR family transcriptional regulator